MSSVCAMSLKKAAALVKHILVEIVPIECSDCNMHALWRFQYYIKHVLQNASLPQLLVLLLEALFPAEVASVDVGAGILAVFA